MTERNMEAVRRLLEEVWTQGNLSLMPELMTEDVVSHPMPQSGTLVGREAYKHFMAVYKGVFLETVFTVEDQFASGDKVATRWIGRVVEPSGNEKNDDSGKQLSIDGITITYHDNSGRIAKGWDLWDTSNLIQSAAAPAIFDQLSITL